ncbi:hypothetical protein C8J55DRAFT_528911 [Lentinula edodes]|uniref:Uncharacterized protein n=1 Tax=Lentinula lateritia TaxID=40482 RepID=A0A9W9DEC7_9AGAR|nr:hypothetical protein C8J55DRAFT_528911 [Lentinula edodes]
MMLERISRSRSLGEANPFSNFTFMIATLSVALLSSGSRLRRVFTRYSFSAAAVALTCTWVADATNALFLIFAIVMYV